MSWEEEIRLSYPVWHEDLWVCMEDNRHLCSGSNRAWSELQVDRHPFSVRMTSKIAVTVKVTPLPMSGQSLSCLLHSQYVFSSCTNQKTHHAAKRVIALPLSFKFELKNIINPLGLFSEFWFARINIKVSLAKNRCCNSDGSYGTGKDLLAFKIHAIICHFSWKNQTKKVRRLLS